VKKDGIDERTKSAGGWTGVENYVVALARRRTARHKREGRPGSRMDPDEPRNTVGTIPFLIMMGAFLLLFVAIASLAWPSREEPKPKEAEQELGTAPAGWLEEAEQEMNKGK
jgi:hypothetical protein